MKSHYARSYPESKQLREQLWLQNTERLEIRALHSGLGLYGGDTSLQRREAVQSNSHASIQLPSVSVEMMEESPSLNMTSESTDENLSGLIASMRTTQPIVAKEISNFQNQSRKQPLPELPKSQNALGEEIWNYVPRLRKIILLHLADFTLVMSIFSMCFMLAVVGYKFVQPDVAIQELGKWEPIKFLLERNWYEVLFAFYGMFLIYWVTFKTLRINTFGSFLVNDINRKQKVPNVL